MLHTDQNMPCLMYLSMVCTRMGVGGGEGGVATQRKCDIFRFSNVNFPTLGSPLKVKFPTLGTTDLA